MRPHRNLLLTPLALNASNARALASGAATLPSTVPRLLAYIDPTKSFPRSSKPTRLASSHARCAPQWHRLSSPSYRRSLSTTRPTALATATVSAAPRQDKMGAIATGRVDTKQRVAALRKLMASHGVDAYVVPSEDAHASEYPAEADLRRGFITGFTGSAGCAVVTAKTAALFTDGRYFLQAGQQLDPDVWKLMKQGEPNVPTWQDYLSKDLPRGTVVGMDPSVISADDARTIGAELAKVGSELKGIDENLVDQVWKDRPARPSEAIFLLSEKFSGRSAKDKIAAVRQELDKKTEAAAAAAASASSSSSAKEGGDGGAGATKYRGFVANMLDEVAWLLNLRGSDVPYNPVFFAFAVVLTDKTLLFVDDKPLEGEARKYVEASGVEIRPYESFYATLKEIGAGLAKDEKILLSKKASLAVEKALGGASKVSLGRSIVMDLKAIKNDVELEGFKQCHVRDGAALASYFAWLEEALQKGQKVDEAQGADELAKCRGRLDRFRGLSFTTISSTGPNAAVIHYSPDPSDCLTIDPKQIYLCDSGGQFTDGTTDVTRTWHFGKPSAEEVRAFTRVLQGHIAIDVAVFPKGTTGYLLDPLARRPLWEEGWDFRHGVGHGVGHFLNVHEGPHGIGTRSVFHETPLKPGMVVSNEPGYYKDGSWGIRIENLVYVREAKTPNNFGDKGYLCFEHLTLCPLQRSLIDVSLLTEREKAWLRDYHAEVLAKVAPELERAGDERGVAWLRRQCGAEF